MASTEEKLFRVLKVAGTKEYQSNAALAREVAGRRSSEFAYVFKGNTHHCSSDSVNHYVSLAQALELLNHQRKPFADMKGALLDGFRIIIADRIKDFAVKEGFDRDTLSDVVRKMIRRNPASVPSLRNIYDTLKLSCGTMIFRRIVLMETFKAETRIDVGLRQVMLVPDIFEG
jgi:hypothetical protein